MRFKNIEVIVKLLSGFDYSQRGSGLQPFA